MVTNCSRYNINIFLQILLMRFIKNRIRDVVRYCLQHVWPNYENETFTFNHRSLLHTELRI